MTPPLDGILIVDLTRVLAGPFCTMLLSDLGARVLKIEHPEHGDDARSFDPVVHEESAYFMSVNRGKESLTLDLKNPAGRDLLLRLARKADVLVENFTPGVLDRLGLGWEKLHHENPHLILASCSGFGQTGPLSHRPAYDLIIQGMAGLMSITGPDENQPTKTGSSIADILAGLYTGLGILSALHSRHTTGQGQWVDVAMLDSVVASLENALARFEATGQSPKPLGNRHPSVAPFATVPTADGQINVACGNDALWRALCQALGREDLSGDERFSSNQGRIRFWAALEPALHAATRTHPTAVLLDRLQQAGVPAGPLNDLAAVVADPQIQARNMLVTLDHPRAGPQRAAGLPIKFSADPCAPTTPAPLLGQHTDTALRELLGLNDEDLARLRTNGALGTTDTGPTPSAA